MSRLSTITESTARTAQFVGTSLQTAGDFASAQATQSYGSQSEEAAIFQANQLRQRAGQVVAGAQRDAYSVDRQARYVASSALAAAAASGGGASDPTVVNLIAKNAGEFAYRKALALYQGDESARTLNLQADAKEYEGRITKSAANRAATASYIKAGASILTGSAKDASLFQRFGGDGPAGGANGSAGTPDLSGFA